jgi:peptidoglycan-associated lipoprotein
MIDRRIIRALPFSMLLLSGCANSNQDASTYNLPSTGNSAVDPADNVAADVQANRVIATTPGYEALKAGDNRTAIRDFGAANAATPHNAYDELNLAVAYQNTGRMDKAEPLDRQAMIDGQNVMPSETTTELSKGHTVAEIACQNLGMGLPPATVPGTATPCQSTQAASNSTMTETYTATMHWSDSYNAYFAFDKSILTREGRKAIDNAAKGALDHQTNKVALVGKADLTGTDAYNMALSQRRADAVRDALVADGVPASSIDTHWDGDRAPPVQTSQGVRNRDNRVVQIGLLQ